MKITILDDYQYVIQSLNYFCDLLNKEDQALPRVGVYENETFYDHNNELLNLPNVICTPHLGYV